jgi:hypothetical protein
MSLHVYIHLPLMERGDDMSLNLSMPGGGGMSSNVAIYPSLVPGRGLDMHTHVAHLSHLSITRVREGARYVYACGPSIHPSLAGRDGRGR